MMTPKQKEHKKARDNLERFSKAILMQYSFHKIKTFHDLLKSCGYDETTIRNKYFPSELNKILTYSDVKEYLSDRRIELTTAQFLELNPPIIEHDEIIQADIKQSESVTLAKFELKKEEEFEPSKNEKAFYFWFQKKAVNQLMKGILGE